jgi:hypothetical protein
MYLSVSRFMVFSFSFMRVWELLNHAATSVGTALAGLGAALAVVHRVLRALSSAGLARVSAKRTHRLHVFVAPRDRRCGKTANIGAFHVQLDATRHRFGVLLRDTGGSTLKARRRTLVALAKAFALYLIQHFFLLELPDIRHLHHLHPGTGCQCDSEQSGE